MAGQKFIVGAGQAGNRGLYSWTLSPSQRIIADLLADIDDTGYFVRITLGETIINMEVDAGSDGTGSDLGPDLLASWENFSSAILIEAGGLSLTLPGPNYRLNTGQDRTEPYQWTLSSSYVRRKNAFVTAYKLLTQAQKDATTITLRNSLAPLRVPVEASQTFIAGESGYATTVDGHKVNTWTLNPQQQIDADLLAADVTGYFGYFQFNDQLTSAEVSLNTSSSLGGSVSARGPDLTALWEESLYAVLIQAGGLSLNIPGPAYNFNADLDHTEPYAWELSLHDSAQARTFFTAYALLTQSQKAATTITLRTSLPVVLRPTAAFAGASAGVLAAMVGLITEGPLQVTAAMVGESAGALAATASLKSPRDPAVTFGVEDFNQTGLEVPVLALVTAGVPEGNGTVYRAASNGGPLGSVSDESDLQVVSGQGVTRIALAVPIPNIAIMQMWDDPSTLSWSDYFNDNPTKTARLQFSADGPAYELSKGTQESDFSTWSTRSANTIRAINAAIAVSGYEFILAIAGPIVDLDATAGLAGSSAGALTATAELQTPDVLQPTAALAGASAGELVATASLLTPVTLNATVALAGESAGSLAGTAGLVTPRTLLLQDFNQTGLDVDVLGIFVAAAPANIYANSDRGGSQSPLAGSDFGIGTGETVLSRVIVNAAGAVVILNDNDKPTTLTMSAHFGSSNTDSDWTLYIQTLDGVASTNALGNTGGGFSQWRMDTDAAAIINAIGANDRVILAIARASAGADLAANATFAGESTGALAATASLLTPAVLNATASLAGAAVGELAATASLLTPVVLQPTAAFAGAAAGVLTGTASLITPVTLNATASLAGESAGALSGTASLIASLRLQDFNQAGLDVDLLGIFVAAAPANIYADSNRGGTQSPLAGSDFGIGSGETLLSRIIVNDNGTTIILNDDDVPSGLTMSAQFGASNTDSDWTLYIQTLDGVASTISLRTTGGSFAQWRMSANAAAITNAIGAGDRVIIAIAKASVVVGLAANATLAGESAGELTGTASLLTLDVLRPTATFTGAAVGELFGAAALLTPATLNATASMAGASAGALGARVSLSALAVPDALQATASMSGESKGLLKTAALLSTAAPVTKLSAAALNRINAFGLHGNKPLTCIEIYHPDVPDNIRVVNDSDDLFIGPDRYLRAAFSATIPQDKEGELPRGELHIDNVGRAMVEWIELSQGGRGAKISIREVFIPVAGNRNAEVSWEITGLDVGRIRMTNERVTAELTDNRVAKAPAVKLRHDVIESPGLQ